MSKIRVAWICHFRNAEIQSILKPFKKLPESAPWITNTIKVFEDAPEVELHIISPYEYIPWRRSFRLRGIHYHFFNPGIPIWGRHWPSFFPWDVITCYWANNRVIAAFMKQIQPDVIHLQGAENASYSNSIFQFATQFPIVVNVQRMVLDFRLGTTKEALKRVSVEKAILSQLEHFSIRTETMKRDLLVYNPAAKTYWVDYSIKKLIPLKTKKEFSIVFFARVCPDKGIEDLIRAFSLVKEKMPDTTLCVIGGVDVQYQKHLNCLSSDLKVEDGITWMGNLKTLEGVYGEASKARVSVLPTHYDIIPGTIIESMQLGIPVVSYKAGSIPELNKERENVLLVEIGDIEGLARNIIRLLNDSELYDIMSKWGVECIEQRFSDDNVLKQHLKCYHSVIREYHDSKVRRII